MKIKRAFKGVPNGQFYPVAYKPGDTVPPELVAAAKAVGADQDYPEGGAPVSVPAQAVTQKDAKGRPGSSGGGKGKAQSPPPPPPPPPPAPQPDLLPQGDGAGAADPAEGGTGEAVPAADGAPAEAAPAEGAASEGAGEGAAEETPPASGEPNLGGLS
jgi:hypothetical protein